MIGELQNSHNGIPLCGKKIPFIHQHEGFRNKVGFTEHRNTSQYA